LLGFFGVAEASFDEVADRLGPAWETVRQAEIVDLRAEPSPHGDCDARGGPVGFFNHGAECARGYTEQ
jgi:hypothetical protein